NFDHKCKKTFATKSASSGLTHCSKTCSIDPLVGECWPLLSAKQVQAARRPDLDGRSIYVGFASTRRIVATRLSNSTLSQHLVAVALLNDALDAAIEAIAVLLRQVLRGNYHHRDLMPVGSCPHVVEEFEAVHLWHHQVENDHVGSYGSERFDRNLPILRLGHLPSDWLQPMAHPAPDHLVITAPKPSPPLPP